MIGSCNIEKSWKLYVKSWFSQKIWNFRKYRIWKKWTKIFFVETWQFIHHLKALVEFRRFLLLIKSFSVFLVEKYSKNSGKIWIFDFFYKIVKKWKNSVFILKSMMLNSKKFFSTWMRFYHKKDDFKLKLNINVIWLNILTKLRNFT